MKLADYFLAASIRIQHLTEKSLRQLMTPILFLLEKRAGDKLFKELTDLLERLLLQQSYFFGKFLLG